MGRQETDVRLNPELVSPSADQFTVTGENEAADSGSATIRHQHLVRMGLVGGSLMAAGLLTAVEVKAQDTDQDDDDRGRGILQDDDGDQDPTRTPNPTVRASRTPFITFGQAGTATATPTPDASPTVMASPTLDASPTAGRTVVAQVPTETPTPGETLVAAADLGPMGEFRNSLADYPGTIRYTDFVGNQVTIETNMSRVEPLMGIDGRPILPGIYMDRPANFDPQIARDRVNINGQEVDEAVLVGTVNVDWNGYGPVFYLSVPMKVMDADGSVIRQADQPHFGQFQFVLFGTGAIIYAVDSNGRIIDSSPSLTSPQIPLGQNINSPNVNNAIIFDQDRGTLTFPTANGPVEIRDGDQVAASFVYNLADIAPDIVAENGGRTPEQTIDLLMQQTNTDLRYSPENNNFQYYLYFLTPQN